MTLLANYLRPLRGRDAEIYQAEVERCESLGDEVLLVTGQARYALDDGGIGVSRVWWLDEFRGGLLWRVQAFRTEAAAREASTSLE